MLTTKIKSAEHLEEHELNKILKYLCHNEEWLYYLIVRLGVSTALRFSDLSQIKWSDILNNEVLQLNEKKTGKRREIPIGRELSENLRNIYKKMGSPSPEELVIPITIRAVNKQIKIHAYRAGVRGKRISTHTWRKTFGREVWKRNNYSEASLIKLSLLFNHSSTVITRIYLDITKEEIGDLYAIQDLFVY
jgi:integrase